MGDHKRWRNALVVAISVPLLSACPSPQTSGPPSTSVTFEVVDSLGSPVAGQAAYQAADGLWASLQATEPGVYAFPVPNDDGRYGFSVNCPSGLLASSTTAFTYQLTLEETTQARVTCPLTFVGSMSTVEGSYDASVVNADRVDVHTGIGFDTGLGGSAVGTFGPISIAAGSDRIVMGIAYNAASVPVAMHIVRDVSVTSATSLDLVFEFHEGLTPLTTPSFSASVPAGYDPRVGVAFSASPSSYVQLYSDETSASAQAPLGVADLRPGDLYLIRSSATQGAAPQTTVGTMQFQPSLGEVDLMLPEPWTAAPTVSGSALPTFLGLRRLPSEADTRAHVLVASWDGILDGPIGIVSPDAMWQFVVSDGWLDGEEAYSVPDLTALPGFLGARPLTGETVSWTIGTVASNLDTRALLTGPAHPLGLESGIYSPLFPPRVAGAVNRVAFVQGSYVVP